MNKLVATITVDRKSLPAITLISILLTATCVPYILWLSRLTPNIPRSANLILFVGACVGILAVHEFVHAMSYAICGARPKFGAKLVAGFVPVLTTSAKGSKLKLAYMVFVGLSPFIILSVGLSLLVLIPTLAAYALAAFAVNFIGSAGDIFMVLSLLRFSRSKCVVIEDTGTSFKVLAN